jgi:excisionase family DNA binding protein
MTTTLESLITRLSNFEARVIALETQYAPDQPFVTVGNALESALSKFGAAAEARRRYELTGKPLRIAALAERWDCSQGKVRTMINAGELPVLRLGTMLRIPLAAVIAIEAQCEQPIITGSAASPMPRRKSGTPAAVALRVARILQARARHPK